MAPAEAVKDTDLVSVLVPDMAQPAVLDQVLPHVEQGALLLFARLHPGHLDVALVAPKAPGALVRREYEAGHGVPCLLAVHRDATGTAHARALAYAHGLGGDRAGILETSFAEETDTDLFGEQAVLCGGVTELVTTGWEVLVEAGYNPELAYFECLHELLIVDLLHEGGLPMHRYVSETASFGDVTRGRRVVDETTRQRMREVLHDIQSGAFAREWSDEHEAGRPAYSALLARDLNHPMEAVGARLRAGMPWLEGAA